MAAPCSNLYRCYSASIPKLPSTPSPLHPLYASNLCGFSGNSLPGTQPDLRLYAKFDKFQGQDQEEEEEEEESSITPASSFSSAPSIEDSELQLIEGQQEVEEEDDSCLPSDLEGAVRQSGQATATFVSSGGMRAILQFLDDEGAQTELWELSRIFLETLIEETGCQVGSLACLILRMQNRSRYQ